jgi:hypothetical protein
MAPVAWGSLLFLSDRYVSLITCWLADDDAALVVTNIYVKYITIVSPGDG